MKKKLKKSEILSFNLGDGYGNFLRSLKEEFRVVLSAKGGIPLERLLTDEYLTNLKDGKLVDAEQPDEIMVKSKNGASGIEIEIDPIGIESVGIGLVDLIEDKRIAKLVISLSELFDDNVIDACLLWLTDAELTEWAVQNIETEKQKRASS